MLTCQFGKVLKEKGERVGVLHIQYKIMLTYGRFEAF